MKHIILAQPRGFCAGVQRAVDIVDKSLEKFSSPIYVRHEIVHNKHVVSSLTKKGAVFVDEISDIPKNSITIFSAHGVSEKVEKNADKKNLSVVDATCPLVKKVHIEALRYHEKGYKIILVGHNGHPEVEGTAGRIPGGVQVVETIDQIDQLDYKPNDRLAYVTQTTLSVDDTREIIKSLKIRFPKIQGPDVKDICYATQNRQKAVRDLADCSDIVLVLGNKNSSNSVRLAEISSLTGVPTYRISDKNEVKFEWFDNAFTIGITAGASTPEILVEELVGFLKEKYGKNIDVEILDGTKEKVNFNLPKELID
mgnify:FL=1|tara:strand:+ start:18504 stop:19436 length:933 start_codon:yes stop_codon:yes gene_type:complete